jgi:hypothetical protein
MNMAMAVTSDKAEAPCRRIAEDRAASLLGISAADLRRLSCETGVGHTECENGSEHLMFTYAELYRLCRFAVQMGG